MQLKKGNVLYVRIDRKAEGKELTERDLQIHLDYVKNIARERYFVGGAFSTQDAGMVLFEAKNLEEAREISLKDPIIADGFYRCEIHQWHLVVVSEDSSSLQ